MSLYNSVYDQAERRWAEEDDDDDFPVVEYDGPVDDDFDFDDGPN